MKKYEVAFKEKTYLLSADKIVVENLRTMLVKEVSRPLGGIMISGDEVVAILPVEATVIPIENDEITRIEL